MKFNFYLIFIIYSLYACEDLNVDNLNSTDLNGIQNTDGYTNIADELIHDWFMANHAFTSPALCFSSASDASTSSWGTMGMRDFGREPRTTFNNYETYPYAQLNISYYECLYKTLIKANDLLRFINDNKDPSDYSKERAVALFTQGLTLGYLGLVYDQAFIITHQTRFDKAGKLSAYFELLSAALTSLDECIRICDNNIFILPDSWIPGQLYDQKSFRKLANSMAARLLAYAPRNGIENSNVNWSKVYSYAMDGISQDFAPMADDLNWHSQYHTYSVYPGWAMVDMFIINLLDPNMPNVFPPTGDYADLPNNGLALSEDARLKLDFEYTKCPFRGERGYYYFSTYRYSRLDKYISDWNTPMVDFRVAENDYLLAEAAVHLNKLTEAANILNNSARSHRGQLPNVVPERNVLLSCIHYERMIELHTSGMGIQFFQMRKNDLLQKGTLFHLPIPNSELKKIGLKYYTFGLDNGVEGVDYSADGWK